MNKVLEELQALIRHRAERFTNLDQIQLYNELIAFLEEESRISMMQEYGISDWDN